MRLPSSQVAKSHRRASSLPTRPSPPSLSAASTREEQHQRFHSVLEARAPRSQSRPLSLSTTPLARAPSSASSSRSTATSQSLSMDRKSSRGSWSLPLRLQAQLLAKHRTLCLNCQPPSSRNWCSSPPATHPLNSARLPPSDTRRDQSKQISQLPLPSS